MNGEQSLAFVEDKPGQRIGSAILCSSKYGVLNIFLA
jgi:hypothetical protein